MAVRKGTPKPDITTVQALKETLLQASSVASSASASGAGLSTELFPKLGFQQVSERSDFKELDCVGTLPEEVQQTIFFSAGLDPSSARSQSAGQ